MAEESPASTTGPVGNPVADPFGALGLQRRFDLNDADIGAARERAAGVPGGDAAFDAIATPRARAETLLRLIGGPTAAQYAGVPRGFDAALTDATGDPAKLAALQAQHWNNVAHLFEQLLGQDKAPTQIGRANMMRAELNALDRMGAGE